MEEYLNTEYCEFENDASASSFGWNFQSNAGIFLFLSFFKQAEEIKIESKLQDIEITLNNGEKVLAQAKSSQDYSVDKSKKQKFKDAIISLAKYSKKGNSFIYISNIPNTLDSGKELFNNEIISYNECLQAVKNEIDDVFVSTSNSIKKQVDKETNLDKLKKLKTILELVESFDKSKLYISVIDRFFGEDKHRYSAVSDKIIAFLVDDLKLNRDDAISIKTKLLDFWQLSFQHNSTIPDKGIKKSINKNDFAWPIVVYLTEECIPDIDECLTFNPDKALKKEVFHALSYSEVLYHERFSFTNRIIQDYNDFRKEKRGISNIEKAFVKECGHNYYDEFKKDSIDDETLEYITKAFIYKIIIDRNNMSKISAGIGAKNDN